MSISTSVLCYFKNENTELMTQCDSSNSQENKLALFHSTSVVVSCRYAIWTIEKYHEKGLLTSPNPWPHWKTL